MSESNEKSELEAEKEVSEKIEEQEAAENGEEESPYQDIEGDDLRSMVKERDEQVEALQNDMDEAKNTVLRKAAELENYRKRVQRERSKIYDTAKANALEDFLSISDDLSRTLKASEDLEVNQTFLEGVTLVASKFDEVLEKHGVERIDQEGVPFNVDIHDALMRQKPEDESVGSDTVLKVVENGYRLGDRTIRHAKVIVSE
jgi:molecular chaperone GrpE